MNNRISRGIKESRPLREQLNTCGGKKKQLAMNCGSIWQRIGGAKRVISKALSRHRQEKSIRPYTGIFFLTR